MSESPKIVIADDEPEILSLMQEALKMEGYIVRAAPNGEEALTLVHESSPDIVILDLMMPIKDGLTVCKELKSDPAYRHLPVVLLSATAARGDRIAGLDLGADDFLTKPIDIVELLARIRMILRRTREGLDANPLTKLPGNVSIQKRIDKEIAAKKPLAVLYLDINNFKAYNDAYGYDAGDRVIQATAQLFMKYIKDNKDDTFLGHIGGDDFILITTPDRMESTCKKIIGEYETLAPTFYKEEDRKRGSIISKDRQGNTREFPFISIAIGVCHNKLKPLTSYAQVSEIGAELKKHAKIHDGSHYIIDRRTSD